MAHKGFQGHMEDACLTLDIVSLVDCSSVHFISAIVGHSVVKICNVDFQGSPTLKFKDINSFYESVETNSEGVNVLEKMKRDKEGFGGITIKLEMPSPEKIAPPCESNDDANTVRKDTRKCLNRESYEDCEEVVDCLTLSELRSRSKVKRRKILKPSTITGTNANDTPLSSEPKKEGHHPAHSNPSEAQSDLDEPLIILKHRLSRKSLKQTNKKRNARSSLSDPSVTIIELSFSNSSMHSTTEMMDRTSVDSNVTMGCVEGMQCVVNQSFQTLDDIWDEKSNIKTNMDSPRKLVEYLQEVDELGVLLPSVENSPYFYGSNSPVLSESFEQNTLAIKSEVSMDANNFNSSSLTESEMHDNNFIFADLPNKVKTEVSQPGLSDKHNSVDTVACPTSDSTSEFHLPCKSLSVEIPKILVEFESQDQQKTFYAEDDFPCNFSMEFHCPCELSDGALEEIGNGYDGITTEATHAEMLNSLSSEHSSQSACEDFKDSGMDLLPVTDHVSLPSSVLDTKYDTHFGVEPKSIYTVVRTDCQKCTSNDHAIQPVNTICRIPSEAANQKTCSASYLDDTCTEACGGSAVNVSNKENECPQKTENKMLTEETQVNVVVNNIAADCRLISKEVNISSDICVSNVETSDGTANCEVYPGVVPPISQESDVFLHDEEHPITEEDASRCYISMHQQITVSVDSPSGDDSSPSVENSCLHLSEEDCSCDFREHTCTGSSGEQDKETEALKACPSQSFCIELDTVADLNSNGSCSLKHAEKLSRPLVAEVDFDTSCSADVSNFINGDGEIERQSSNCCTGIELEQPPKKLLSNRKVLSPTSQEKLCRAVDAEKPYESMQLSSSKKRLLCEKFASGLPLLSEQRELESMGSPERMIKKARSDGHPSTRSILKPPFTSCRKASLRSSLTTSDSQDAIKFSQRQMHDIGYITGKLVSGLKSMKGILAEILSSEAFSSSLEHTDKLRMATEDASVLESTTEKYMAMLARDHKRFCKIMRSKEHKVPVHINTAPKKKAITFADEAGGLLCHVKLFDEKPDTVVVSEGYRDNR